MAAMGRCECRLWVGWRTTKGAALPSFRRALAARSGPIGRLQTGQLPAVLNQLVRAEQQFLRNREAERLGGLEINRQLELPGLLYGKIGRSCTAKNPVNIFGAHAISFDLGATVGDQGAVPRALC